MKGFVRVNSPLVLNEFDESLDLTDGWARDVLKQLEWNKLKGTTSKVDPSPQFLAEE